MADPKAPQLSQQMSPELLQQLLQMPSAAPQGPLGSAGQGLLNQTDPISQMSLETSRKGLEYIGQSEATKKAQQAELAKAIGEQQTIGPRSFQPHFAGKSLLGKIGEGLLTIGASTRPGQNIENVVYAKPREQYARKAAEIEELQKAIGGTTQALGAEAGMTSKPIGALGTYARGIGIEENAQVRMQQVSNQLKTAMRGLDIKETLNKAIAGEANAKAALDRALPDIYRQRIALGYDGNQVKEDLANVLAQEGVMDKFQVSTLLDNILGTNLSPSAPQTQRGGQPEAGAKPLPPKSATPSRGGKGGGPSGGGATLPKGTIVTGPDGTDHVSDGTTPSTLPKGWVVKGKR